MNRYSLEHLADVPLMRGLEGSGGSERAAIANFVAYLGEVDARELYKSEGFASMFAYSVERLHLSEDSALKRIQAARTARKFPGLFEALADGRLNLSAVCLLAPHLSAENSDELVRQATHRTNAQIQAWVANRFVPPPVRAATPQLEVRLPPAPAPRKTVESVVELPSVPAELPVESLATARPVDYEMRFTVTREAHERFRHAQALLSHAMPTAGMAEIYERAIEVLIAQCEKRKAGVTAKPRVPKATPKGRSIPAHVRRAVWKRDGGRCTFVAASGHRCGARSLLEFDHIVPVARGGRSTVENVRLRCRTHNQVAAKQTFGSVFMNGRRARAAAAAAAARRDRAPWETSRAP